jgi:hypothetical protein
MSDRVPPTDKPFTVVIRPKHFENAVCENANKCLIAQALRATFPGLEEESLVVGTSDLKLPLEGEWRYLRWRHDGRHIVRAFDQGLMRPGDAIDGLAVTFRPVTYPDE